MEKTERELLMQALTAATDVVKLINQSIGLADAHQTAAEFRRLQFKIIPGGKESEKACGIQKFSKKEIEKMPTFYKNLFISGEVVAHWRRRSGNGIEIRCQIAGKKITASGKTRQIAAERFIARLQSSENPASGLRPGMLFRDFAVEWLQTAKRPNVKPATYVDYLSIFRAHLLPAFGDRRIDEIRQMEIQSYLNALLAAGKSRAAQKHLQILKSLFQTAVENDIIKKTPATGVKIPFHETETGQALSRDETRELVARCLDAGTRTGKAFIFLLFTGLRRSELAGAELVGDWLHVVTAKQRLGRREKVRKIPIAPALRRLLPDLDRDFAEIRTMYPNRLSRTFKEWIPAHHLHDLRHTFITRAQECGIPRELVSLWAGHKADNTMTSNVYTHFSDEFQIEQIKRYDI